MSFGGPKYCSGSGSNPNEANAEKGARTLMGRLLRIAAVLSPVMVLGPVAANGQAYPSKPLRFLTTGIGASTDLAARTVAQGLSDNAGWNVIVDNRGNTIVAAEFASRSPPDGYTLLVLTEGLWRGPLLQKMPYDPARYFVPITLVSRAPNLLVVHPSWPVKSVKELIALAKARPGELNYASGSTGSSPHLAAELFRTMAKVNVVRVPY